MPACSAVPRCLLVYAAQMPSAAVARLLSPRLASLPRRVRNSNFACFTSPTSSSLFFSSSAFSSTPHRVFSLSTYQIQPEPSLASPSVSSLSQLSFAELVARSSSFLVDYYEAPTASPIVAAQLLTALQQFNVDGQQRQLKERLEGELDELVNEGKRRERRLGDETPLNDKDKDDAHDHEHEHDILRVTHLDDDETLEHRIIARPPLPPHLHDLDLHVDGDVPRSGGGGGVARGKFDSAYSTDQLLVDSLPNLKEEEAVQLGRRDVMKLMATRE